MRRRRLPVLLSLSLLAALAFPGWGRGLDAPRGFDAARGDGSIVRLATPDGRLWAAWSYDAGAENDIAVSVRSSDGLWSDPEFLGSGNGRDEGAPALAVDAGGTLYLAFGVRNGSWIGLSIRPASAGSWTAPARLTPLGEFASRPSARVIGDRLVVAYRTAAGTALLDLPVQGPARPQGIQDGPDILPPTGNHKGGGTIPGGGSGDPLSPAR